MNPNSTFIAKYERAVRITEGSELGDLLDLAVILRVFLIDSPSIIDATNRNSKLKILYMAGCSLDNSEDINQIFQDKYGEVTILMDWLGNDIHTNPIPMNKQKFLSHKICMISGVYYSIKDVTIVCANSLGGAHFGPPRSTNLQPLIELSSSFYKDRNPVLLLNLVQIAKIVTNALKPLYDNLKSS